jgi:uncharacterized protein
VGAVVTEATVTAATGVAEADRRTLLHVARRSVERAAVGVSSLGVDPSGFTAALRTRRGCFVTLDLDGALRGCVGVLVARRSLVEEVAHAAHGAACRDPRFVPLDEEEAARVALRISVLSSPTALCFGSEAELLAQLEPGRHGVILRDRGRVGTFLPVVWEHFESPLEFFRQLKQKAGLAQDHFSPSMAVETYTAESFGDGPSPLVE